MNGRLGLAAWRWLFVLDFFISVPVVIFGLMVCPGKKIHVHPTIFVRPNTSLYRRTEG
jgi:hypothetical protein